jgi:ribosomal small subunit protein bTHX
MGKGDKKSKRGKIVLGTFGVRRLRNKCKKASVAAVKAKDEIINVAVNEEETLENIAEVVVENVAETVAENVAETVVKPKVVKEKTPAKEAKPAKEKKETKEPKSKK